MKSLLLVIDMQKVFSRKTPWQVPATDEILPRIKRLVAHFDNQVLFSRHIPPPEPKGSWHSFYQRWRELALDSTNWDVVDELKAEPAKVFDKITYSCFGSPWFVNHMQQNRTSRLIVVGVETDICVLASVYDAVDAGYSVTVVTDALASGNGSLHQATLNILARMPEQVTLVTTSDVLANKVG